MYLAFKLALCFGRKNLIDLARLHSEKKIILFFFGGIRDVKFVGTRGGTSAARVFRYCSTHVAALTYHKA